MRIGFIAFLFSFALLPAELDANDAETVVTVKGLMTSGHWAKALATLESTPTAHSDPALKELLGMAYLYAASDIDSLGHLDKARTLMKQLVDSGGKARFLVSLGRDTKKEAHLLDSTPGELIITTGSAEFVPSSGSSPQRWDRKDITECALNTKYGKSSNSFHLTIGKDRDRSEHNFRPWHFSADESNLVCSLMGIQAAPRR